jgi:hypothetical protein
MKTSAKPKRRPRPSPSPRRPAKRATAAPRDLLFEALRQELGL